MSKLIITLTLLLVSSMALTESYPDFKDQDLESLISEFYTTENLITTHEANEGQNKNYPFYDKPDMAPGSYWYVSQILVCIGKDNIGINQLQTTITNSKTGQKHKFNAHGLIQRNHYELIMMFHLGRCRIIDFTQDDCVNWAQVGYKSGRMDKDFRGFKLRTRSGKVYEFATGDKKTVFYQPISFGTQCLSGFHGTFKHRTEEHKGFVNYRDSMQTIGFYSDEMYQKPTVNSVSKITGSWRRAGSGSNAGQTMEREIIDSKGNTVTKEQSQSLTVQNSVTVGFSYSAWGFSASTSYSHSRSKEESQSVAKAVSSQLQRGIKTTCSTTCPPSNGKRTNVFQWVWDLQSSGPLGQMEARTCDYVCNYDMRKPPRCHGSADCLDEQCTDCIHDYQ